MPDVLNGTRKEAPDDSGTWRQWSNAQAKDSDGMLRGEGH